MAGSAHTQIYKDLISVLTQQRYDAGLSQAALAGKLDKPPSFVGKYEQCERRLDVIEFIIICKALSLDAPTILADFTKSNTI